MHRFSQQFIVYFYDMSLLFATCFPLSRNRVYFVGCAWQCGLFVLMYLICSLCLMSMDLPDCPTYALLHVLNFSLYVPFGFLLFCFLYNCCCKVLVTLNATFKLLSILPVLILP